MAAAATSTMSYTVRGLTCGECIARMIEHLWGLPEVEGVSVDLIKDGQSVITIRSSPENSLAQTLTAVERVGFELTGRMELTGHWPGPHGALHPDEMWFPPNRGGFPRRLPVRSPRRSRS